MEVLYEDCMGERVIIRSFPQGYGVPIESPTTFHFTPMQARPREAGRVCVSFYAVRFVSSVDRIFGLQSCEGSLSIV